MPADKPGWGGSRKGAGRPHKLPVLLSDLPMTHDPKEWLLTLMRCAAAPLPLRCQAAKVLLRYEVADS